MRRVKLAVEFPFVRRDPRQEEPMSTKAAALVIALALATLSAPAFAQTVTTPAAGSADRTAIMDAMRAKGDDQNRVFVVRNLRVSGDWAWLDANPQSRDGRNKFEPESALLRRVGGGWRVVDQPCGEEDCETAKEVARIRRANPGAPAAIFPR
jgi:hypothetical protein